MELTPIEGGITRLAFRLQAVDLHAVGPEELENVRQLLQGWIRAGMERLAELVSEERTSVSSAG